MAKINGEDTAEKIKNKGQLQTFDQTLRGSGAKLLNVLPLGLDEADRKDMAKAMIYLTIKAYSEVPELRRCSPDSIIGALMDCATLGMMPFSKMNECTILPYGNKASMQIMYRGIIKLCKNTGEYKNIRVGVVREGDTLEYYRGVNQDLRHYESKKPAHDRAVTHIYALYELINGGSDFAIMTMEDIKIHRDEYSKQYKAAIKYKKEKTAIWVKEEVGMSIKTVLIKLMKYAPKSNKLIKQLALDRDLKREIAPERKDFTEEKEAEFARQRNADATGIYDTETDKDKEKSGKKKAESKEPELMVNQKDIAGFYAKLTELGFKKDMQEKISDRIKKKYKVKSKKDLTVSQLKEAIEIIVAKVETRKTAKKTNKTVKKAVDVKSPKREVEGFFDRKKLTR